jgi:AraC-like DNA-binding protein
MYMAVRRPGAFSLGQLAAQAGYYDQAHFNRDFKHFVGSTPAGFLNSAREGRDYIQQGVPGGIASEP